MIEYSNIGEIRRALKAFYDGTATPEQVEALERWSAKADGIPPDLRADAAMLRAFARAKAPQASADLERRILRATVGSRPRPRLRSWRIALGAAASLALLVGAGGYFLRGSGSHPSASVSENVADTRGAWRELNDSAQVAELTASLQHTVNSAMGKAQDGLRYTECAMENMRQTLETAARLRSTH